MSIKKISGAIEKLISVSCVISQIDQVVFRSNIVGMSYKLRRCHSIHGNISIDDPKLGTGCKFIFITGRRCIGGSTYKLHFFNPFHHLIKGIGFFIL